MEGTEEEQGRHAGVMGSPSVAEWCLMVERETEYSTWMVEKRTKRSKERRGAPDEGEEKAICTRRRERYSDGEEGEE